MNIQELIQVICGGNRVVKLLHMPQDLVAQTEDDSFKMGKGEIKIDTHLLQFVLFSVTYPMISDRGIVFDGQ